MHYWNYRVVKKKNPDTGETYFEVCEVYYDKEDRPHSWTEDKNLLVYEELDEVREAYKEIQTAFDKPVLEVVGDSLREIEVK